MESCEIDIKLEGRDVSRRVRIPGAALLGDLHVVIQASMGWQAVAFHRYEIDGDVVGDTMDQEFVDAYPDSEDQDEYALEDIFGEPARKVAYVYGDWKHTLTLHAMVEAAQDTPECLDGKGACPADGEDGEEIPFKVSEANDRIGQAFLTINHYDASEEQDARIWQEVDLDDMLSFVIDYLGERHSGLDAQARMLAAKLQVLVEAMHADEESPEVGKAMKRLRDGGLPRAEAVEALVALMTETPEVIGDEDADDAFEEFLVACESYNVDTFKKKYPQGAIALVQDIAKKAADQARNQRKRQRK